jgi:hypothetical protein
VRNAYVYELLCSGVAKLLEGGKLLWGKEENNKNSIKGENLLFS